ncbi:MAG: 2OG-Fe(II) oxygenase [Chitinophagales bacterium]
MGLELINKKYTNPENLKKLAEQFQNAQPCKHIMLENFFEEEFANTIHDNFPAFESLNVVRKSLNENKREDYHFERWHPAFAKLRDGMITDEVSKFMSTLTGIEGLFTNTDSLGQGVHQGGKGSFLDVHIDVNVNVGKGLWRRVNLLVYMNKGWQPEWKGDIEIWNKDMTEMAVKYPPTFNTAVIFLTDKNSPHGYEKINFPDGEYRKSYYAYFFTPMEEGVKYEDSRFLSKPTDSAGKKIATSLKENLKITAKQILSKLNIKSLDFQDKNKKD